MRGILYVRFAEKSSSCPHCNFLPDGRSRHNPASQSSKFKSLSDGRREGAMRLSVPPTGSFTAAAAYFLLSVLSFLTSSPYFLSLRGVGEESISRGKSRGKSKTKTSPCGLVFVFREIIEFKFKRVYLRSFFIETSESDAI